MGFLGLRLQRMRRGRALLPHRRPLLRLGRPRAQAHVLAVLIQPLRRAEQGHNSIKELLSLMFYISFCVLLLSLLSSVQS